MRPATICSPVWASRWTSIVGSSSCRRRSALPTFSSSPFAFGSIANAITGRGSSGSVRSISWSDEDKHVARAGLLQLGDRADVAGPELVGVLVLLALGHQQLPDPLLVVGAAVVHLGVVLHHALVDAKEVDPPRDRDRRGS